MVTKLLDIEVELRLKLAILGIGLDCIFTGRGLPLRAGGLRLLLILERLKPGPPELRLKLEAAKEWALNLALKLAAWNWGNPCSERGVNLASDLSEPVSFAEGLTTTNEVKSVTKLYLRAISVASSFLSASVKFPLLALSSSNFSMVRWAQSLSMKLTGRISMGGKGMQG